MPKLNQKGVVHLIPLILLLAGIVAGAYLVQHPQIFKPKAYLENITPLLYQQRIDGMKTEFKIAGDVDNEEVQRIVKEDLFKSDIIVEGDIVAGDAQVSVTGDCTSGQTPNYDFSEYGVFPPLCLDQEQKEKAVEFALSGAESAADFIIPYSQAKKAIELGSEMETVKGTLKSSGIAERIQMSAISSPDSSFGGYIVTLIRIKELEEDVKQNPDGSGNLTLKQEEARREYVAALRELWEKQHNLSLEVAGVAALSVIDKPLKVVGTFAKPITGPLVVKAGEAKNVVFDFLNNSWGKLIGRVGKEAVEVGLDQIRKWQARAKNFKDYWQTVKNTGQANYPQHEVGSIQAMFLGEKPAVFETKLARDSKEILAQKGLKFAGDYVYDPELVQEVIEKYADEFQRYGFSSSEEVMNALAAANPRDLSTIRGLVLGFPESAVRDYAFTESLRIDNVAERLYNLLQDSPIDKSFLELNYFAERSGKTELLPFFEQQLKKYQQELNLNDSEIAQTLDELQWIINGRGVNIHGVYWVEYRESVDSVALQNRLKQAFEQSGILTY